MDPTKKILILYASAGHGHEKAAKAILDACHEIPGTSAKAVDTLHLTPGSFGNFYRRVYLFQIQYAAWLWGIFYHVSDIGWVYKGLRWVRRVLNGLTAQRLERLILEEKPDTIIATHFMSVEVASHLKGQKRTNAKIISVITDYLPHRVWTADHVDLYAVALAETGEQLKRWGIAEGRIRITGIPVEKKFLSDYSAFEMRSRLRLDLKAFTVLITSGGSGIGLMREIVHDLLSSQKAIQILAVCGTNQILYDALKREAAKHPLLKVFGFIHNMQELMAASDLVIGKGGGLTVTESFSQGRPMILFQSIPGQETRNAFCVDRYGAGLIAKTLGELVQKVCEVSEAPDRLESMKKGVQRMFRRDASKVIAGSA